jgi:hypothetical protein
MVTILISTINNKFRSARTWWVIYICNGFHVTFFASFYSLFTRHNGGIHWALHDQVGQMPRPILLQEQTLCKIQRRGVEPHIVECLGGSQQMHWTELAPCNGCLVSGLLFVWISSSKKKSSIDCVCAIMNFRKKFWPFDANIYVQWVHCSHLFCIITNSWWAYDIYILVNNKSSSSFALGVARVCKMMIITFLLPILLGPHLILYNFKRLRKTRCWVSRSTWFFSNFLQGWRTRCRMQFFPCIHD